MKFVALIVVGIVIAGFGAGQAAGQEDISRRNDLPNRIGGNSCTNQITAGTANLQGSINLTGTTASEKPPVISIVVYGNGTYISRQRIKNGGSFNFTCLPERSVTLIVEVDSVEVANYSLGQLSPPPGSNRQDLNVSWSGAREAVKRKTEVIAARNLYKRSEKNQKAFDKAMLDIDAQKPEGALKALEKLVADDAGDFVAWTEIGYIHLNANKFSEATVGFDKALAINRSDERAIVGLGRAHIGAKAYDKAIELLKAANEASSGSADINHYLGEAYLMSRKGSLAIVHMNKAIEIDPVGKSSLHLRMANLYHAAGAKALAANEYKLLIAKVPNHPDKAKIEAYIKENDAPANK